MTTHLLLPSRLEPLSLVLTDRATRAASVKACRTCDQFHRGDHPNMYNPATGWRRTSLTPRLRIAEHSAIGQFPRGRPPPHR